jgi:predicted metal-binding membrane protein
LAAITLLAWGYMAYEARAMNLTGVCQCFGMKMSGPDVTPRSGSQVFPLFLMWAEMMVAMMVPSAAGMILTFAAVQRRRREQARPYVPTGIFLGGYLTIWTAFSALTAIAQWALHGAALLSPGMVSASPVLGSALLVAAGIFQWTPFKNACLTHCRSPFQFLMTDWREGNYGAFVMGLRHGAYCTGCCWFLMALLFVAGVMNMWWVAAISVLVLLEKLLPRGNWFGRLVGVILLAWGLWMAWGVLRGQGSIRDEPTRHESARRNPPTQPVRVGCCDWPG